MPARPSRIPHAPSLRRSQRDAARSRDRGAFTVLEVIVALALASLVVGSAYGLLAMLNQADRVSRNAAEESTELLITHAALQRAFTSMVAAPPLAPGEADDSEGDDSIAGLDDDDLSPEMRDRLEAMLGPGALGEDAGVDERLRSAVALADRSLPPHFELYYEEIDGYVLPRLEVVLHESPVQINSAASRLRAGFEGETVAERRSRIAAEWAGSVRGVFELIALDDRGWALVWQPIQPLGRRTVLIDGLAALEWQVLLPPPPEEVEGMTPQEIAEMPAEWVPVHRAWEAALFPDALSLKLVTTTGARADWRFETLLVDWGAR